MKRRTFLGSIFAGFAWGQHRLSLAEPLEFVVPPRFTRPSSESEEGGLWGLMDREERKLRNSPFLNNDEVLKNWLQDMVCKLGADHCPDIRVHLVRTPFFNANMAPNGMMQVWTGLLLRVENEAQLAAVLGHEIGHFLRRHSLERLRDIKSKAGASQVLAFLGRAGGLGSMAMLASTFSYGRDHEREADRIGAYLMYKAGYDIREAAKVWGNLIEEQKAGTDKDSSNSNSLFATHPPAPERQATLTQLGLENPGGITGHEKFRAIVSPHMDDWLQDEVRRGQYAQSIVLFSRLINNASLKAQALYYRGESYRLRGEKDDLDLALTDYLGSSGMEKFPPEVFRGMGLIHKNRGKNSDASQAFSKYLELSPTAPDAALIQHYLKEIRS